MFHEWQLFKPRQGELTSEKVRCQLHILLVYSWKRKGPTQLFTANYGGVHLAGAVDWRPTWFSDCPSAQLWLGRRVKAVSWAHMWRSRRNPSRSSPGSKSSIKGIPTGLIENGQVSYKNAVDLTDHGTPRPAPQALLPFLSCGLPCLRVGLAVQTWPCTEPCASQSQGQVLWQKRQKAAQGHKDPAPLLSNHGCGLAL